MQSLLEGSRSPSPGPSRPTHVQEQEALRDETISAFHHAVSDDEDDELEGGLLTLREKTKDELERQEEEYRAYLEREVGDVKTLIQLEDERKDSGDALVSALVKEEKKDMRSKKRKARKEETDQEFLLKCVYISLTPLDLPLIVHTHIVISLIVVGLIANRAIYPLIRM